jgi:hypothetical protein
LAGWRARLNPFHDIFSMIFAPWWHIELSICPRGSTPLCGGYFWSWLGSKPEVDYQYNHPDCIWILSRGYSKSISRLTGKSIIITVLQEIDGRTWRSLQQETKRTSPRIQLSRQTRICLL